VTSTCDDGAEYLRLISIDRAAELLDVSRRCGVENAAEIAKHEREALQARGRAQVQKIYARRRNDGKHSDSDARI